MDPKDTSQGVGNDPPIWNASPAVLNDDPFVIADLIINYPVEEQFAEAPQGFLVDGSYVLGSGVGASYSGLWESSGTFLDAVGPKVIEAVGAEGAIGASNVENPVAGMILVDGRFVLGSGVGASYSGLGESSGSFFDAAGPNVIEGLGAEGTSNVENTLAGTSNVENTLAGMISMSQRVSSGINCNVKPVEFRLELEKAINHESKADPPIIKWTGENVFEVMELDAFIQKYSAKLGVTDGSSFFHRLRANSFKKISLGYYRNPFIEDEVNKKRKVSSHSSQPEELKAAVTEELKVVESQVVGTEDKSRKHHEELSKDVATVKSLIAKLVAKFE